VETVDERHVNIRIMCTRIKRERKKRFTLTTGLKWTDNTHSPHVNITGG